MYSSIVSVFYDPKPYLDIISENVYNAYNIFIDIPKIYVDYDLYNITDNFNNILNNFNNNFNNIINNDILLNNLRPIMVLLSLFVILSMKYINYYYNDNNKLNRLNELYKMNIEENNLLLNDENNKLLNDKNNEKNDNNKLYLKSLNEIRTKTNEIISKINKNNINNINNNYIVLLRVKMKYYISMMKTNYKLHNKNNKYNKNNDFITKDVYMIMGINFNNINKNTNINSIIVYNLNYLNKICNELYNTEDFIIIAIGNSNYNNIKVVNENVVNENVVNENVVNENTNDKNISDDINKSFININYDLNNLKDIIFSIKDENNNINSLKYTLTLPIHNIYNMLMDICNNTIFESKLYSIDNNNIEKWNNIQINDMEIL